MIVVNNDNKKPRRRKFTKLTKSFDTILNGLLNKELIELHPIIKYHFPYVVIENYRFEEFCNYHRDTCHLTTNCKISRHIIQDLIDQKIIKLMISHNKINLQLLI